MDVESQKSERRRGGFLDVFLVVSVMCLFAAVTALAVVGVMAVKDVQSRLEPKSMRSEFQPSRGESADTAYTNFAYLEATKMKLENSTMQWSVVHNGDGSSVGSNFVFDSKKHSLTPSRPGTYFIYINLNLTCTFACKAGLLTVHVGDKLTCQVQLPELADSRPVNKKCWTVSRIDKQPLITQMTVPKEGLNYWQLELNSSGFGMFLVD